MPSPSPSLLGLKLLRRDTLPELVTINVAATGTYTLRLRKDEVDHDLTFVAVVPTDTLTDIRDGLLASPAAATAATAGITLTAVGAAQFRIEGAEDARWVTSVEDEPSASDMTFAKEVASAGDPDFFGTQVAPAFFVSVPNQLRSAPVSGLSLRAIIIDSAGVPVAPGTALLSIDVLDVQRVAGIDVVSRVAVLAAIGLDTVQPVANIVGGMKIGVRIHTLENLPATADEVRLVVEETAA